MRPAIELTSVPTWAVAPNRPAADTSGRYWTVVAFGDAATGPVAAVVSGWLTQIAAVRPAAVPRVHWAGDDDAAVGALAADLATALVGWRLMLAGPAASCLKLRAHAIRCHVGDDEIVVATTDVTHRDVSCAHCRTVTRGAVELEGTLACSGCARDLFVYHHVSRRVGAHLGFLA